MPVTMSGYGQSYMPMGGPGVGAAIYGAQRQEVNFARMVELQKLNLQKRALRQQAAAQAAQMQQREQARQDELAMQQTRFDLEERKLDMQDAETQQRRQDILDAYERAAQEKSQRDAQALQDERNKLTSVGATEWDGQGERPKQYYTMRDGTVYDLSGVDMGKVRGASSPQAGANPDAIRKEMNELSKLGARPLSEGETFDTRTHYTHIGADGRVWLVQRTDGKGNPVQTPEEQPPEGFDTLQQYTAVSRQFGEQFTAANLDIVNDLKNIVGMLDISAKREGIGERNKTTGEMEIRNYSLNALRFMKNKEDSNYDTKKISKEAERFWGHAFDMAEAMVELHDAREAMLHQNEDNPDYKKAHQYFKASKTKPYEDGGYRGEDLQNKLAEAWKTEGLPQYIRDANERYRKALEAARNLGWDIPTDRTAFKYIDDWYRRIKA